MEKLEKKGLNELKQEVINTDLCSGCGACDNLCPYIDVVKGKSVKIADCDQDQGNCYKYCPQTLIDIPYLEKEIFGTERTDPIIGVYKTIKKTRTVQKNVRNEAQYGGVTSELVRYLLEKGETDGFILTKREENWETTPVLVTDSEQVLEFSKSKYTTSPNLAKINELREERGKIGIVGTPCQITAARKMEIYDDCEFGPMIGLFCTWALKPEFLEYVEGLLDLKKVEKFDIPPPPAEKMLVHLRDEERELPLEEVRDYVMTTCNSCMDMTSEFADMSIGQVEGVSDWNTIIVRSDEGESIFNGMVEAGLLEIEDLEKERVDHLREAATNRKKKVLTEMEEEEVRVRLKEEDKKKILEMET